MANDKDLDQSFNDAELESIMSEIDGLEKELTGSMSDSNPTAESDLEALLSMNDDALAKELAELESSESLVSEVSVATPAPVLAKPIATAVIDEDVAINFDELAGELDQLEGILDQVVESDEVVPETSFETNMNADDILKEMDELEKPQSNAELISFSDKLVEAKAEHKQTSDVEQVQTLFDSIIDTGPTVHKVSKSSDDIKSADSIIDELEKAFRSEGAEHVPAQQLKITPETAVAKHSLQKEIESQIDSIFDNLSSAPVAVAPIVTPEEVPHSNNVVDLNMKETYMKTPALDFPKELPSAPVGGGQTQMSFAVSGQMNLKMSFNVAGKNVEIDVSESQGLVIAMPGGLKLCLPLSEVDAQKKAS